MAFKNIICIGVRYHQQNLHRSLDRRDMRIASVMKATGGKTLVLFGVLATDRSPTSQKIKLHSTIIKINVSPSIFFKQWRRFTWAQLRVSDLIRIENGDTFPADTLILNASTSAREDGRAYVQTTSLDGETNLKMKLSCLPVALKSLAHQSDAKDAAKELERYVVKCLAPNADVRVPAPPALAVAALEMISFCRCTTSLALCARLSLAKRNTR
jgi:hypothetical protein